MGESVGNISTIRSQQIFLGCLFAKLRKTPLRFACLGIHIRSLLWDTSLGHLLIYRFPPPPPLRNWVCSPKFRVCCRLRLLMELSWCVEHVLLSLVFPDLEARSGVRAHAARLPCGGVCFHQVYDVCFLSLCPVTDNWFTNLFRAAKWWWPSAIIAPHLSAGTLESKTILINSGDPKRSRS